MDKNKLVKLFLAVFCVALYFILTVAVATPEGLSPEGQKILALMVVTIIAWVFEVVPIAMSSVFSLMMMLIIFKGSTPPADAMKNFAIPTIFFIMCSFCFAQGFTKTGLGHRLSLSVSTMFGKTPNRILLAFMVATGVISSVLADIPTAIIFSSIALPLLKKKQLPARKI